MPSARPASPSATPGGTFTPTYSATQSAPGFGIIEKTDANAVRWLCRLHEAGGEPLLTWHDLFEPTTGGAVLKELPETATGRHRPRLQAWWQVPGGGAEMLDLTVTAGQEVWHAWYRDTGLFYQSKYYLSPQRADLAATWRLDPRVVAP